MLWPTRVICSCEFRTDQNLKMDFCNNWLFRLESIGTLILCIAASVLVFLPSNLIQPGLVLILEVSIFLALHCIL